MFCAASEHSASSSCHCCSASNLISFCGWTNFYETMSCLLEKDLNPFMNPTWSKLKSLLSFLALHKPAFLKFSKRSSEMHHMFLQSPTSGAQENLMGELFLSFFLFGHTHGIRKFPGQGSNPSHSCDLRHSFSNTGSLNPLCQVWGVQPVPQQLPKLLQRQHQVLAPPCHSGNSKARFTRTPIVQVRRPSTPKLKLLA